MGLDSLCIIAGPTTHVVHLKLMLSSNCTWPVKQCKSLVRLRSFNLAVFVSGFHSGCHLICCTDGTVICMLTSSLPEVSWSLLDSGLLEAVVEVSKSCHNWRTKHRIKKSINSKPSKCRVLPALLTSALSFYRRRRNAAW